MTWLPFDLHPEYPADGLPREQLLARYGPGMTQHVREFFASRGLEYAPHPDVVPNTRKALQLGELARDAGLHATLHDRLMDAYWSESQDIGDHGVLRRLAREVGLPADGVEEVLATDLHLDRVTGLTQQAVSIGANAVPAFVVDRRLLVLGAQPQAVFEQAFAQLAEAS